jgi:hypothetical protein
MEILTSNGKIFAWTMARSATNVKGIDPDPGNEFLFILILLYSLEVKKG